MDRLDGGFAAPARSASWRVLVVLTGMNLVNYLDRYVVPAVQERIRHDLSLSDGEVGLLTTAFVVVYMVASPLFGWLGDTRPRMALIGFGVAVWSVATASSGLAATFLLLLITRMFVGVGEAAYGTIAPAVLSDVFPLSKRGRVFSIFYAAIPVGSALGYLVGGWIGGHWGWRHAFFFTAIPGAVLATLAFALKDPPRGGADVDAAATEGPSDAGPTSSKSAGLAQTYRSLWENRLYVLTVAGYAAATFAIGGMGVWLPSFLERERHFSNAAETVGALLAVSGLLGTLAGGWLGDHFSRRSRVGHLWVSGVTTLLGVPTAVVLVQASSHVVILAAVFVTAMLSFVSTGPINSLIVNVVSPHMRATALAVATLAIHLLGDALSAYAVGVTADLCGSLAKAMLMFPVVFALSGLIWVYAAATHAAPEAA